MFHGLTDDVTDSDFGLNPEKAALVLDGGNAIVRTEDGTLLDGPVNADGTVTPREGEFRKAAEPSDFFERAEEFDTDLTAARAALEAAAT